MCDWSSAGTYWLSVEDFDLAGYWKLEWALYIFSLSQMGMILTCCDDDLVFSFNGASGQVTAKLAYNFIVDSLLTPLNVGGIRICGSGGSQLD